jgi:Domain of unknown function in PX-proteins (DUF3818)
MTYMTLISPPFLAKENIHILAAVLRSGEEPVLSRAQMQRVVQSHRAHQEYLKHRGSLEDSDDDDGPQNEDAWLFEDLTVLTRLYSRLKDKDQLISLIFEVGRNLTIHSLADDEFS